ncbi:MAG TPA: DUF4252 domain-containing protein [Terriglobales bacterium]|nr:DUF4252 domain-containing protein [Terriglobales bacterium]
MKLRHCVPACLLLLIPAMAQQARLRLDLPAVAARASEVSDVTLDGAALRLGMAFVNHDSDVSPQERDMLSRLQGIYVKSYEFDHGASVTDADLEPIRAQLRGPGWTRMVRVQQRDRGRGDETDEVYLCTDASGNIQGMAVLSRQANELDVVNIIGRIEPSELAALGGHLGIPKLDLKDKEKGK